MTPHNGSEPLSHVDAAWLRMDTPKNPMVITAALLFEGPVPFEAIERVIREKFLIHARFRQRVVEARIPLMSPRWELDPHFDLRLHLRHVRLPAPGGERAFDEFVSDLMSTRLDPLRPLWQSFVVDDAPGGTALVTRIHHCIADGISLVKILLSLCDDQTPRDPQKVGMRRPKLTFHPAELARRAAALASTTGKFLFMPADPETPLRGPLGVQKRAARSRPVSLPALKELARRHDAKLNDVLLAAVSGALRAHLGQRGSLRPGLELRTLVPVFLQGDVETGLGNHFGLVFLELPLGTAHPIERIREVKQRMDKLKARDDATIAFAVLDALGIASQELEHVFLEVFSRKASLLTSNVPGPPERSTMAGHGLRDLFVWAPVTGYIGVGITLISYAGQVYMSVHTDSGLVADPRHIARAFEFEVEGMLAQPSPLAASPRAEPAREQPSQAG